MSDSDEDFKPLPPSFPESDENIPVVDGDNDSVIDSDSDDDYRPPPPPEDDDDDSDNDSLAGSDIDIDQYNTKESDNTNTNTFTQNFQSVDLSDDDISDGDDDDDDEPNENYLQKFDDNLKSNTISSFHPELLYHNNEEVEALSRIVRNEQGIISDPLHVTFPFITKYERARVLGERSKQLGMGAKPLIEVGPDVIDPYLIALSEYEQKRIPFIIKRPLPNGGCEYWKFKDLESI